MRARQWGPSPLGALPAATALRSVLFARYYAARVLRYERFPQFALWRSGVTLRGVRRTEGGDTLHGS